MKKKVLAALLVGMMSVSLLAGCSTGMENDASSSAPSGAAVNSESNVSSGSGSEGSGESTGTGEKLENVVLCLSNASDNYIGTVVGETIKAACEEAGANVQVVDAANNTSTHVNQIQNAATQGADLIYVFPAGDGPTYAEVLKSARDSGIVTVMSNNYPGDGVLDCYVGNDEFQMGAMMAAMVSEYIEETWPDAGAGEIPVLTLEASFNENAIRRCIGMRLIAEKYLREGDITSGYFVKEDGDPVYYLDEDGNEVEVDEPTGGLILDENGYAQLNPYYNEKVKLVEYSDKSYTGTDSTTAQNAIENTVTMGEKDLKVVMSYGDTGAAIETKLRELCESGQITTPVEEVAAFCSDLTDTNKDLILRSADNSSVLRGVMASGNLVNRLCENIQTLIKGGTVQEYEMMVLSYECLNDNGSDIETVTYDTCPQLPDTELFFPG